MPKNKYYSLTVNEQDSTADLYIFGDIVDELDRALDEWWFGTDLGAVSSLTIVNDLEALDVDTINVHINSYGGLTSEGLAIYNTLKNHKAKVVTWCDGFACSAASIVFMAGEERIMGDASLLMIHNAWMSATGNAVELRDQADVLDKISQGSANAYASAINLTREELDKLMDGPTIRERGSCRKRLSNGASARPLPNRKRPPQNRLSLSERCLCRSWQPKKASMRPRLRR